MQVLEGVITPSMQTGLVRDAAGVQVLGAQQAAVASLTNNLGVVGNDDVVAVPDPADAPGTADALRDDLVANTIPAIRGDLADLTDKLNTVLTRLRAHGIIAT